MYNSYGFESQKTTYKPVLKEDKEVKTRSAVNIGTVSMMMVFIGLCLVVLSALCLSSARSDYSLSKKLADHNSAYYEAYNLLEEEAAKANTSDSRVTVPINDYQQLSATVKSNKTIDNIKVENIDVWESDLSLPVMQ